MTMVPMTEGLHLALDMLEHGGFPEEYAITAALVDPATESIYFRAEDYSGFGTFVVIDDDGSATLAAQPPRDALAVEGQLALDMDVYAGSNQPRIPKGFPGGGRWTDGVGGGSNGVDGGAATSGSGSDRAGADGGADGGTGGAQLHLKDGRTLTPVAAHPTPAHRLADLQNAGLPTPTFYELDPADAGVFHEQISELKRTNKYAAAVEVKSVEEYASMRLLVTEDGRLGLALDGDNIVSAYSHADASAKGGIRAGIATAVELGGRRADSFDTVLPHIYAQEGLTVVSRVPWNDEYAPDGWDKATYAAYNGGEPDVVLYAYDPQKVGVPYSPGSGQTFEDWDDASSAVDNYLSSITAAYSPSQPRAPKGSPNGGQWVAKGGGATSGAVGSGAVPAALREALGSIEPQSYNEARRRANPSGGDINCQMVVTAMEARARGLDAVAKGGAGGGSSAGEWPDWFEFPPGRLEESWEEPALRDHMMMGLDQFGTTRWTQSSDDFIAGLNERAKAQGFPPGARGVLAYANAIQIPRLDPQTEMPTGLYQSTLTFAHVANWEWDGTKITVLDGQDNSAGLPDLTGNYVYPPFSQLVRVDDVPLSEKALTGITSTQKFVEAREAEKALLDVRAQMQDTTDDTLMQSLEQQALGHMKTIGEVVHHGD